MIKEWKTKTGFTLVELLVSMGILAVLFAISTIVFSTIIPNTSQSTTYDTLISDIRSQQTLAMSNNSYYGVHLEGNSYTLFKGVTYSPSDASNFVVTLDPTVSLTGVTFPGSQIVFSPGTGDANSGSFSITNSQTNNVKNVNINKYGATF